MPLAMKQCQQTSKYMQIYTGRDSTPTPTDTVVLLIEGKTQKLKQEITVNKIHSIFDYLTEQKKTKT